MERGRDCYQGDSDSSVLENVNDILDLSKIEAGKMEIRYEAIDPNIIFNELRQIFEMRMSEKKLEFIIEIDKHMPSVLMLDEARLRQVLLNLIGNSVKFTEKGYIKLSAQRIEKIENPAKIDLIISVEDTGVGIPEDQFELIFESFRQQDGQSTRKYGGTGLGLAISKRLVEMMEGRISVKSSLGVGSVFEITLKDVNISSSDTPLESAEKTCSIDNISFEKARVLVVDDIEFNRNLLKELLSRANLEIVEAEDGEQALFFAEEYMPDIIIMDIRMPVMDGYEATSQLKKNQKTKDIPVIALTASSRISDKSSIAASGFDGYLPKPVNMNDLLAELLRYLKHTARAEPVERAMADNEAFMGLSPENIDRLSELTGQLQEQMIPVWQEIDGVMEMDVIEDFADRVMKLAENYKVPVLIDYAQQLHEFSQSFDITNIDKTLNEFPEIVNALAKTRHDESDK